MPITVPGFAGGTFTIGGPASGGAPAAGGGFMDKLGNGLFGPIPAGPAGVFGDPQEQRRRQMMTTAAAMMQASGPSTQRRGLGQIVGASYLAGQEAGDQYQQDAQRRAYMQQLQQQQQMAVEKAQRERELETQRAKTMGTINQVRPEALEQAAMQLYQQGDAAGAESALEMAHNIRLRDIQMKNAETNAAIAARGNEKQYSFVEGPNGLYRTNPQTGAVEQVSSWPQFAPGKDGKGTPEEERQAAIEKDILAGRIRNVEAYLDAGGNQTLGSPKVGAFVDNTFGRFFGTEDAGAQRELQWLLSAAMLEQAAKLKPISNNDITFLQESMPKPGDPPATIKRWLGELKKRTGITDVGVTEKYGLEKPGSTPPSRGATRSF